MSDTPSPTHSPSETDALVLVQDAANPPRKRGCRTVWLVLVVLVLALALASWLGYQQWQTLRAQWSAQLAQSQAASEAAQAQTRRVLETLQTQSAQLASLQADQARMAAQVQSLGESVEAIAPVADNDSPVVLLGEVGRLVEIAQQSLRLSRDVGTALVALESAQTRLIQRQELPDVQQALQEDIERLRAVPAVDVGGIAARLNILGTLLAQVPLLLPETLPETLPAASPVDAAQAAPTQAEEDRAAATADASWWQGAWQQTQAWSRQTWQALWQDVRGLVQVRRIDDAAALLISPDQAALLRDTLQHRVVVARLALLMHQADIWRAELDAVQQMLQTRFDMRQPQGEQARALAQSLRETPISVALPTLERSIRAVDLQRERWSGAPDNAQPADAPEDPAADGAKP